MIYFGVFKTIEGNDISVIIGTAGDSAIKEGDTCYDDYMAGTLSPDVVMLEFGETPVVITGNSEGVFAPLKLYSATVTIITKQIYADMYSGVAQGVDVAIRNEDEHRSLFYGYITPYAYSQDYTYLDELELEFVSPISSLGSYKLLDSYTDAAMMSFYAVIKRCLDKTNYYTEFYFPKIFNKTGENSTVTGNFLRSLYINTYNFVEDDDEHTVKSCKDVLAQICTYFGLSLVEHGTRLYFIDINSLRVNSEYNLYNLKTGTVTDTSLSDRKVLGLTDYFQGGGTVTFDEIYNKITCNCNLYEAESELTDVFDDMEEVDNYDNHNPEVGEDYLAMSDASMQDIFSSVYEIYDSHYKQKSFIKYYKNDSHLTTYWYEPDTAGFNHGAQKDFVGPCTYIRTQEYIGATLCKTSANKSAVDERLSGVTLDNDILITSHKSASANIIPNKKPSETGSSPTVYSSVSVEAAQPSQKMFTYTDTLRNTVDTSKLYLYLNFNATYFDREKKIYRMEDYKNEGDKTDKARWIWAEIKIGNYYVSGKYRTENGKKYGITAMDPTDAQDEYFDNWYWSTTPSLVRLYFEKSDHYNGTPQKLVTNMTWDKFLDETDGVAFNLSMQEGGGEAPHFNFGDKIEVSLYRPHSMNTDYRCDCVFIKGFSVEIKESSLSNVIKKKDTDVLYTNETVSLELNKDIVDEYSDLELDINTQCSDRLYSYSSVLNSNNEYNRYIYKKGVDQLFYPQEYNLITQYYNYYSLPRIIFEADLNTRLTPYTIVKESHLNKFFIVDSYEYNVLLQDINYKLYEYGY